MGLKGGRGRNRVERFKELRLTVGEGKRRTREESNSPGIYKKGE